MTNPTGVFVRLHDGLLNETQIAKLCNPKRTMTESLLSIGTPVAGGELCPIGYINEDAIGGLATGIYQSASIFRDEDVEHHDTVALTRLSEALAKLAERDAEIAKANERCADTLQGLVAARAEIARYRGALIEAKTFHEEQDKALSKQPPSSQGSWRRYLHQEQIEQIDEALKGPEA